MHDVYCKKSTYVITIIPLCSLLVYHMMETGWVKVSQTDVRELHYQYQDEKLGTNS